MSCTIEWSNSLFAVTRHERHGLVVCNSSNTRQMGCVFQDMEPPKVSSILRKSSVVRKPIRRVKFTKIVVRHAVIRDQNPSLGMICPGELHQRSSNAQKFEVRCQKETEWQERCAREAAWKLAKQILKLKEKDKKHSSRCRKISVCLRHQSVNLRKEHLLKTPGRCT